MGCKKCEMGQKRVKWGAKTIFQFHVNHEMLVMQLNKTVKQKNYTKYTKIGDIFVEMCKRKLHGQKFYSKITFQFHVNHEMLVMQFNKTVKIT